MRLNDKVALITGAARGQGAVEAKLFSSEGAKVVICDILDAEGKRLESEINSSGGSSLFVHLDVTEESEWQNAIETTLRSFGKIDILVNNAGIYKWSQVEETTSELWDQTMDINAKGVFLGTKHAISAMRHTGGGSIVNISSVAGLVGSANAAAYCASKGAVRLLTKSTAMQYAKDGIRANSVHPGIIDTPMTTPNLLATKEARERSALRHPLGRVGTSEDVAYGVLFLASDESSFMTGAELVIDGGLTAQ